MNNKLSKEEFVQSLAFIGENSTLPTDYLYDVYEFIFDGLKDISINKETGKSFEINNEELVFYILGEFIYSTRLLSSEQINKFVENEKIKESMCNVIADKYLSLSIYNHVIAQHLQSVHKIYRFHPAQML